MGYSEVIGLGRSGIAAAQLLKQDGWNVTLSDAATKAKILGRPNSQAAQPILPQAGAFKPAALNIAAIKAVVVVLPLVPVMPTQGIS